MKNNRLKKVYKNFYNFTEEELWLQNMWEDGWVLKQYSVENEDGCKYIFAPAENEVHLTYKIDFREFKGKEEFEEYKEIFEDAGWTLLSPNKQYSKHILYADSTNSQTAIFSDQASYIEREKRRMSSSLSHALSGFLILAASIILYRIFEITAILGGGLVVFIFNIKYIIDYFKYRKVYKSLSKITSVQ